MSSADQGAGVSPDIIHHSVIVARLADFARFSGAVANYESDQWLYMRTKLRELEGPIIALKDGQLAASRGRFLRTLAKRVPDEGSLSDFRAVLDRYLSPGDFVDAAFLLEPGPLADPAQRRLLEEILGRVRVHSLFDEERKEEAKRSKAHERPIKELWGRLGLDLLEQTLRRKPRTRRRKAMVLRRLRANVAEWCCALHLPTSLADTFSPFMLTRVEALVITCLRFLERYR